MGVSFSTAGCSVPSTCPQVYCVCVLRKRGWEGRREQESVSSGESLLTPMGDMLWLRNLHSYRPDGFQRAREPPLQPWEVRRVGFAPLEAVHGKQ